MSENNLLDIWQTVIEEHTKALEHMSSGELLHYVMSFVINLQHAKGDIKTETWLELHRQLSKLH